MPKTIIFKIDFYYGFNVLKPCGAVVAFQGTGPRFDPITLSKIDSASVVDKLRTNYDWEPNTRN